MRIVVVGAGLLGLSSAWHLARAGHEVTVLERRSGSALETSFANASLLTPSLSAPWMSAARVGELLGAFLQPDAAIRVTPRALASLLGWGTRALLSSSPARFRRGLAANLALARYSLQLLAELRGELPREAFDHAARGTLMVFRSARSLAHASQAARQLAGHGVAHEVLDGAGLLRMEPALHAAADRFAGAVFSPADQHGDPWQFGQLLERQCRAMGVRFEFDTTVLGLPCHGGQVAAIETDRARHVADRYVLAAGSFSPALARPTGLHLPVRPVRGYSITYDMAGSLASPGVPVLDGESHCAVTPLGTRLRVTGFAELAGFDTGLRPDRAATLARQARALYPRLLADRAAPPETHWCGLRPLSCDGVPLIGATRLPNLYLNTGHGTLGWTMAMGSGRALADLLGGRRAALDMDAYAPLRFA